MRGKGWHRTMGITSRLARFVVETSFPDIPGDVVERSKEMMLNAAAVGLAGSTEDEGRIIVEYVREVGGRPECTLLGARTRSSAPSAALANGLMVHVLDYDENVQRRSNHPSNAIFPTVMAMSERLAASGEQALASFAIGCEVSTKIGAIGDLDELFSRIYRNGWHVEGVGGAIGAAAAAGKLLGLDQERMENAFGMAVSQASGVQANYGTSAKSLHCGQAAMHGIMSATLAKRGFTGARNAIEDPKGFLACYRGDRDVDEDGFVSRLGRPYDIIDPGVRLKLYPCASATHTSVDAALHLVREHRFRLDDVRAVRVSVAPGVATREAFARPATGLEAKFSMSYCVAVALAYGAPRMEHFSDEAVRDPTVGALLDRVSTSADEVPTRDMPRPSTVTVTLADGRRLTYRQRYPRGHPDDPMTAAELDAKVASCAGRVLSLDAVRRVIAGFRGLDTMADVTPLFASLGASA